MGIIWGAVTGRAPGLSGASSAARGIGIAKIRRKRQAQHQQGRHPVDAGIKASPMQWVFLVLGLGAALVELHTGTFYLAAAAAAALLTALIGFWIRGDLLIFVFVLLCAILMAAVMMYRRHRARGKDLADFDIGQTVTIRSVSPQGNCLMVSYRGVNWDAVMEDGSVLAPGGTAIIMRKTDKLLHLALPPEIAQT
jgi:membrane protein implicated in regulation of membrane protease activity